MELFGVVPLLSFRSSSPSIHPWGISETRLKGTFAYMDTSLSTRFDTQSPTSTLRSLHERLQRYRILHAAAAIDCRPTHAPTTFLNPDQPLHPIVPLAPLLPDGDAEAPLGADDGVTSAVLAGGPYISGFEGYVVERGRVSRAEMLDALRGQTGELDRCGLGSVGSHHYL